MESRANYVATGTFVLLVLAGIGAAAVWLAGGQLRTEYALYETHISGSVSGLDVGAPVRLNGIDVGRVARIEQDPEDPQRVILGLQIRREVNLHSDAVALLEMQGLTGGRYVEISGGTPGSPMLTVAGGKRYATIASRPSSLDAVLNDTPQLVQRLAAITDRLQSVLNDQNLGRISETLANLSDLTALLNRQSQDVARLLTDGGTALHNLAAASATLGTLMEHLDRASVGAEQLVASANVTFARTTKLANDLDHVVQASGPGLRELTTTVPARLDAVLAQASRLMESLDRVSTGLERDPSRLLLGVRQGGYRPP